MNQIMFDLHNDAYWVIRNDATSISTEAKAIRPTGAYSGEILFAAS